MVDTKEIPNPYKGLRRAEDSASSHPLLDPAVFNNWPTIQRIIAPPYRNLIGHDLNVTVLFVPPRQIASDHDMLGASGDIVDNYTARAAQLKGLSPEAIAKFYITTFHELSHLDDLISHAEPFTDALVDNGLLSVDHRELDPRLEKASVVCPTEVNVIYQYVEVEHMIVESKARLFSYLLANRVFAGHPSFHSLALQERNDLLGGVEIYSGNEGGFYQHFSHSILALLSLARYGSIQEAWQSLHHQQVSVVSSLALEDFKKIQRDGFPHAVIDEINDVFKKEYGLRPYKIQYLSGTPDELNSIARQDNPLYKRLAWCAQPDSFEQAMRAVRTVASLLDSRPRNR